MKNLNIKNGIKVLNNKITLCGLVIASLTSCGKKEVVRTEYVIIHETNTTSNTLDTKETNYIDTTEYTNETEYTDYEENTYIEDTTIYMEDETEEYIETETIDNDNKVKEYFDKEYQEIKEYISNVDTDKIKSKGKDIFVTFVDFMFYDGEIKGIKYNDLKEGMKEQLYSDFCTIDELICMYVPDYKENISDKYSKVKDFISPKYSSLVDKIKNAIGEDNLEIIEEIKQNDIDTITDLYNKGKQKIKEKYENFRDNE